MKILLEACGISRFYVHGAAQIRALEPLSLHVGQADFLVVTGPSGAGKSTLLNILSGLDRPSTGQVLYLGECLDKRQNGELARIRNEEFGFIFQTPHLLWDRTVFENVTLPFHYGSSATPEEIRERCGQLLDYVGLQKKADRYPNTLSGGEMQRVVFARALARKPRLIFADEPTGSLDGNNARKILTLLQEQVIQGCGVVMVTHDSAIAAAGNRFLHLKKPAGLDRVPLP